MSECSALMQKPQPLPQLDCNLRLLLVVKEFVEIRLIIDSLEAGGLTPSYDTAATEEDYWTYLSRNAYDAVLVNNSPDWGLSGEGNKAIGLLKLLRRSGQNIPIILITEALGDEVAVDYIKAGITDYLLKEKLGHLPTVLQNSLLSFQEKQQQKSHLTQLQQQAQQQEVINLLLHKMSESSVVEDILQTAVNLLHQALGISRCLIFRPKSQDNLREVSYVFEASEENESLIGVSSPFYGHYHDSLSIGQPVVLNKIEPYLADVVQKAAQEFNFSSVLVAPIIYQNQYLGGIALQHCQKEYEWAEEELNLCSAVANQVAVTIHQAQQEARLQELEAENKTKTAFLDHTSHELRTPLTGILGFSRVLLDQLYGPLNDKQLQYLQGISSCGEHLLSLINDLLDISKIDADREELYWEDIPVEELCLASLSLVQEKAKEGGLELLLEIEPGIVTCRADQRRLKQILVNLLSNAVKFTESGSINLKVMKNAQVIKFLVIDTGIGISEANQKKLFQPFSQIESHLNRKHKGTGLGLALSRKLARLHGGDITLSSQPEEGSCFTVSLPLQQEQ